MYKRFGSDDPKGGISASSLALGISIGVGIAFGVALRVALGSIVHRQQKANEQPRRSGVSKRYKVFNSP